ncbi:MAG: CvpA family protein [Ignavibacteria bacterium]|nr:CvpA family protein [Ignavibacteria bacterium]
MNYLDVIILILILIPALLNMRRGLLKSIFSLAAIILGLYIATRFHQGIVFALKKFYNDERVLSIISFCAIIIIIYLIALYFASKISNLNFLTKFIDKIGGFAFGLLKGLLIASILLLIANSAKIFTQYDKDKSVLYPYVINVAPKVYETIRVYITGSEKSFMDLNNFFFPDININK